MFPLAWVALVSTVAAAACDEHLPRAHVTPLPPHQEPNAVVVGLDERPVPTGCQGFPVRIGPARLVRRFPGLTFERPLQIFRHPAAPYWYVVEQGGTIRRFADDEATTKTELVTDIQGRISIGGNGWEDGLLGAALSPGLAEKPELFVKYTTPAPDAQARFALVIDRLVSVDGGATFSSSTSERILSIERSESFHHGGAPAFGPDGFLYVPVGDGTWVVDDRSQDLTSLQGKILRIDVSEHPYRIPPDNPFVGTPLAREEIWASGFRNPHGWSFDPTSSALWVGDVGLYTREEISRVEVGKNYGWPFLEGTFCTGRGPCEGDFEPPAFEYPHVGSAAVIGGPVYQGARFPEMQGKVVIADFVDGRVEYLDPTAAGGHAAVPVLDTGLNINSLALDTDGELLIVALSGGLYGLERAAPGRSPPSLLSETGCVDVARPFEAPRGMIPYDVNMELWSDGTDKSRWFALPADGAVHVREDGGFDFPIGTVLVKNFYWGGRPIESRLLVRHDDGEWGGYGYAWRDDGSDAVRVDLPTRVNFEGLSWLYPSRSTCGACHTEPAHRILGLTMQQLDRDFTYEGGRLANQLTTLEHIGVFDGALPEERPRRYPARDDVDAPVAEWARAYLHSNCAHCHVPGGSGGGGHDLRSSAVLRELGCDRAPDRSLGIEGEGVVVPGHPERSVLLSRVTGVGGRMPPIATTRVDDLAVARLSEWIATTSSCDE
jgi:uncharacterized repeat protein (TIGR03806 family)